MFNNRRTNDECCGTTNFNFDCDSIKEASECVLLKLSHFLAGTTTEKCYIKYTMTHSFG